MDKKVVLWIGVFLLLISFSLADDYQQIITTTQNNVWSFGYDDDIQLQAQSFNINGTGVYVLDSVSSYMRDYGNVADSYIIRIETDTANHPSGILVSSNATMTISGSVVTNTYQWFDDSFANNVYLNAGVKYWIVWSRSGALSTSDWYAVGRNTARTDYPSHEAMVRGTDGTWDYFGGASQDLVTSKFNYSDPIIATPTFEISAYDSFNSTILNVTADILYNGTTYSFNGTSIDTGLSDTSLPANITISSNGYDSVSYLNYDISLNIDQELNLTLGRLIFNESVIDTSLTALSDYVVYATAENATVYNCSVATTYKICLFPKNTYYDITVYKDGYAYGTSNINYTSEIYKNASTIMLYPYNSLYVSIRDSDTEDLITSSVRLTLDSEIDFFNVTTTSGTYSWNNLTATSYNVTAISANYTTTRQAVTVTNYSTQNITIYLTNTNTVEYVVFVVKDERDNYVEGATLTLEKYIGGSYVSVSQETTDFVGSVYFYIDTSIQHRITISADGYTTRSITPNFVYPYTYTIKLQSVANEPYESFVNDFNYVYRPTPPFINWTQSTFNISVTSTSGALDYWGLYSDFNGTRYISNITDSPNGGSTSITLPFTNETDSLVKVTFFFVGIEGKSFFTTERYYLHNIAADEFSLFTVMNDIDGEVPDGAKPFIALFVSILVIAGLKLRRLATGGAAVFGMLILTAFTFFGWFPILVLGIMWAGLVAALLR